MRYPAIVFDLDGTLLDSLDDIANAANEVLAGFQLPVHPREAFRYLVGDGVATLFERALPAERRDPEWITRCVAGFRETYSRQWNRLSRPYDGIPEMLDALVGAGCRLAVLSNKPQEFTEQCVAEFFGRWAMRPVLGQRPGTPRKPDPAGALEIAAELGVAPAGCLYLGDTSVDMRTARNAGMFATGALWGFRPREELVAHGAEALVAHPREVLALI